jgi:hypothetical protein
MPTPASLNLKQRLTSSLQTPSSSNTSSPSSPLSPSPSTPLSPNAPPKSPLKQNLQNLIASAGAAGGGLKGKLKAFNFRGGNSSNATSSSSASMSTPSFRGGASGPNGNARRSSYGNIHHTQAYPYGQQQSAFQGSSASLSSGFLPKGHHEGEDAIDEVMGRLIFQAGVDFE